MSSLYTKLLSTQKPIESSDSDSDDDEHRDFKRRMDNWVIGTMVALMFLFCIYVTFATPPPRTRDAPTLLATFATEYSKREWTYESIHTTNETIPGCTWREPVPFRCLDSDGSGNVFLITRERV